MRFLNKYSSFSIFDIVFLKVNWGLPLLLLPLTFRRLINASKASLTLLPAAILLFYHLHWSCTPSFFHLFQKPEPLSYSYSDLDHYFHTLITEWWLMLQTLITTITSHSDDAINTASSAYSRQFTFKSPTFIPISPFSLLGDVVEI